MFKQEVPTLQLSVEHGTATVPADGQYHVLLSGDIVFSSKSKKKAFARRVARPPVARCRSRWRSAIGPAAIHATRTLPRFRSAKEREEHPHNRPRRGDYRPHA